MELEKHIENKHKIGQKCGLNNYTCTEKCEVSMLGNKYKYQCNICEYATSCVIEYGNHLKNKHDEVLYNPGINISHENENFSGIDSKISKLFRI